MAKASKRMIITEGCIQSLLEGEHWEPIPEYGDLMTMEEFIASVKAGLFIDYDGFGNYSDGKRVLHRTLSEENDYEPLIVNPSDVKKGKIRKGFSHVVWYNR